VLEADLTLARLAETIMAAGGPEYEFFTVDPLQETTQTDADGPDVFGGVPLGNIRNAFLYNRKRVELLDYTGLTREVLQARGVHPFDAFDFSRDPLEGVFLFNGEVVTIINNHFTSRFGSTPVFGGPQPFVQAGETERENQSLAMNQVVEHLLDDDEEAHVIVLGDLNTFEFTNDLTEILPGKGAQRIMRNLGKKDRSDNRYSFNFDGNSQALDHMFVTDKLYRGAKFEYVQLNVDFPRRFEDVTASDHEPLIAWFRINERRVRRDD
jgi:predicted extracellular nuclease